MMSGQSGLQTPLQLSLCYLTNKATFFATTFIRLYFRSCSLFVFLSTHQRFNQCWSVCLLYSTPRRPCTTSSASTGSSLIGSMQSPKYYRLKREVRLCTHTYSMVLVTIVYLTFKSVFRLLTRLIFKVLCSGGCENGSAFF